MMSGRVSSYFLNLKFIFSLILSVELLYIDYLNIIDKDAVLIKIYLTIFTERGKSLVSL
jgi:hypothetical protein